MGIDYAKGLKKLRKEHDKTQQDVANETSIARAYISAIENGRRTPNDDTLKKILSIYDITQLDFLIDYCGVKRTNTIGINNGLAMKEEIERIKALNNENDPTQQLFSNFVDIAEIKGFEFDGEPLSDKEQTALLSIIELIKSNKE